MSSVFVCANCWHAHTSEATFMDSPCPHCDASSSWQRMLVCALCSTPVHESAPFQWRHTYEVDSCVAPSPTPVVGMFGKIDGEWHHRRVMRVEGGRVTLYGEDGNVQALRTGEGTFRTSPGRGSMSVGFTLIERFRDDDPTQDT